MGDLRRLEAGALETLASRSLETPEEPYFFHRPGWTWRWRSYLQVADQAARGAGALQADLRPPQSLSVCCRQEPDALAVVLALQAAGRVPVAYESQVDSACLDGETWAEVEESNAETSRRSYLLPRCHHGLEVWQPTLLEPRLASGSLTTVHKNQKVEFSQDEIIESTRRLGRMLEDLDLGAKGGRPILSSGPGLDPLSVHLLLTWTLWHEAAWVLEPEKDAFVAAVQWSRPTVVMATGAELEELASTLGESRQRKRWRLRAVVALGGGKTEKARRHWTALGVEFRQFATAEDGVRGGALSQQRSDESE